MAKSQERLSTTIQRGQPWCRQHLGWPLNLYHEQTNKRTKKQHRCVCLFDVSPSAMRLCFVLRTQAGVPPKIARCSAAMPLCKFCVKFLDPRRDLWRKVAEVPIVKRCGGRQSLGACQLTGGLPLRSHSAQDWTPAQPPPRHKCCVCVYEVAGHSPGRFIFSNKTASGFSPLVDQKSGPRFQEPLKETNTDTRLMHNVCDRIAASLQQSFMFFDWRYS